MAFNCIYALDGAIEASLATLVRRARGVAGRLLYGSTVRECPAAFSAVVAVGRMRRGGRRARGEGGGGPGRARVLLRARRAPGLRRPLPPPTARPSLGRTN